MEVQTLARVDFELDVRTGFCGKMTFLQASEICKIGPASASKILN
jgi:hypothetical protein